MFIDINKIDEDGLSFERALDLSDLDDGAGQEISAVQVRIRGSVERNGETVDLTARL